MTGRQRALCLKGIPMVQIQAIGMTRFLGSMSIVSVGAQVETLRIPADSINHFLP